MEYVSPFVESIRKHLGFLVCSNEYVEDMKKKMKELNHTEKDIKDSGIETNRKRKWLEDANNLNERSNLIEAIGGFNMAKRYKVGKQSYGILEEIKDLDNRVSKINEFSQVQKPLAEVGSTSTRPSTSAPVPMVTQNNFESRNLIFNNALQALQSNNESEKMIALCGMGGVGKTTMMEQLKKAVKDANMFDSVVKVVIGENSDPIAIQHAIAQYLGNDLTESAKDARADRLRKIFEAKSQQGQKKILVIMDDLWKEFGLTDVGLSPLPNGFKLLFTSRFENECTKMGVRIDSIFKVHVLNETEANNLFFRTVGPSPSGSDDAEFQRVGEQIVKKCGGLPIAIITIAKILSGNIKESWEEALFNLQQNDLQDFDGIVDKIFKMSYNNLKKEDKEIFLLSGLFPDDFNILIEDLMMYAWGLKLFSDVHTLAQARRHANICVNNLIRANLLIESDKKECVKMHDLVRAFVLTNFSKVKQASIIFHDDMSVQRLTKDVSGSYERILLNFTRTSTSKFPLNFDCSNLCLLIMMNANKLLEFPEDTYKRMKKLEVISYESLGFTLLPVMFEHSTKFRTIRLSSCLLIDSDISFLGSLCNLEILSLVDCKIRRLPSTIGKLKKLKLLELNGCFDLLIDEGVFKNLYSLEELYMRAYKGRVVRFTHANCEELQEISPHLFALELEFIACTKHSISSQLKNMSFKNLKRFKISIGCELKRKNSERDFEFQRQYFENYSFKNEMNELNLVATCNELHECNISDLFEETEELYLEVNDMYNLEDISMHHTFCQLKVFNVSSCANLTCLFTPVLASGLKKLERLTISKCPVLKALVSKISGVGTGIAFQKLTFMSLEDLPNMVTLCEDVIQFPELVELRLCELPKFTSIYHDDNSHMSAMQPLLNTEVMMPKLEKLDISKMTDLKQIWPCVISNSEKNIVSMLRQIDVRECDNLNNLFPRNPLPLLNHLEELEVGKCGSIEVLFNIDFERVGGIEYNSRLRSIRVEDLGELKELWRMRGVNNSDIVINGFKVVEEILIIDCQKFTNIFTPTTTNFDLGALTTYITRCDAEESSRENKLLAERDEEINITFNLLHKCHHLQYLELYADEMEVVFEMDSHQPLLLPYLKFLKLEKLEKMSHVWKCNNWNKFLIPQHQPSQLPFQNLTEITLWDCHKIKYLFSPLMAKYLSNLKSVEIVMCDGIEEVISSRDDEESTSASSSSYQNTSFFPHLEILELVSLSCLKSIDDVGDQTRSGNLTNTIHCESQLEIGRCGRMMEVFESELSSTLTLENITTTALVIVPQLSNLKHVRIEGCDLVQHIFTFSMLASLNQLKHLEVRICNGIQVIVKEENDESSSKDVVVLPRLERLELEYLPNLKGFFLGKNDFRWPSLDYVMINNCPQLMMFTGGESKTPKLEYVRTRFRKHSVVECGLNFQTTFPTCSSSSDLTISKRMPLSWSSFHNLIEINIPFGSHVGRSIIPSNVLLQLEKLQKIYVSGCRYVEEVFEVAVVEALVEGSGFNESQTTTPLVTIPNLTQMHLEWLHDLKCLWKSNRSMVLLEFPNLTTLSIKGCNSLEHVFTCSMVGSLVQLQDLQISHCDNIEVIVKEEEENCDSKVNEIYMLPHLKSLQLLKLPRLKGLCLENDAFSLPVLDTLQINGCVEIRVFTKGELSTPNLKRIDTSFGMYTVKEDLNSFIETNQEELAAAQPSSSPRRHR